MLALLVAACSSVGPETATVEDLSIPSMTPAVGREWPDKPLFVAGKLTVAKVDIDNNPMSPNQFAVRGIPTLILFKDGKPAATQVGALPKSKLKDWISGNI